MRITNKIVHNRLLKSLRKAAERVAKTQERIASKINISRPSDDPIGLARIMSYHRDLHKLRQTIKNAESASGALRITDTALQQVGDLMIDARNKAVAMASDTVSESARPAVAAEIQLMIDQMLQKANTEFGGRYIFSGHRVLIPPYQQVDGQIKYLGDQGKMAQKVELSGSVVINIPGTEIFGAPIASFSLVAPDSAIAGGAGLDDGVIAAELNTAFANDGITLSPGATVAVMEANERWQITDNSSTYYIESYDAGADDNRLRIYSIDTSCLPFTCAAQDATVSGGSGLDDSIIAAELNTAFVNNGITLSPSATVTVMEANERWQISDNTCTYYIENYDAGADDNRLRIYPESHIIESGVFKVLEDLRDALEANDVSGIKESLSLIDTEMDRIAAARGEVGVKIDRVETSIDELHLMNLSLSHELSQIEDVDIVMEAGEYMANQEAYQAALEATASVLRLPTLVDYLR